MVSSPTRTIPFTIDEVDDDDDKSDDDSSSAFQSAASSSYQDPHSRSTDPAHNLKIPPHYDLRSVDEESSLSTGRDMSSLTSPDPHSLPTLSVENTTEAARERAAEEERRRQRYRPTDVSSLASTIDDLSTVATKPTTTTTDPSSNSAPSSSIVTTRGSGRKKIPAYRQFGMCLLFHMVIGSIVVGVILIVSRNDKDMSPKSSQTMSSWQQLGQALEGEAAFDWFGHSVALSANGSIVAAGGHRNDDNGYESGHVRIFRFNTGTNQWTQIGQALEGEAAFDGFGHSVALSADGSIVAAGGYRNDDNGSDSGHVRIFQFNTGTNEWKQLGQALKGEASFDKFGHSVALSADGSIVAAGGIRNPGNGSAYGHVRIFQFNTVTNEWDQIGQALKGEVTFDLFGQSVALSADGNIVAAGGNGNNRKGSASGHVRVFEFNTGSNRWQQLGQALTGEAAFDFFGSSVSLSADGSIVAAGGEGNNDNGVESGHVRIFQFNTGTEEWDQVGQTLEGEATGDFFGHSVALSADGSIVAAGGHRNDDNGSASGHIRIFQFNMATKEWAQAGQALDGEDKGDFFGHSVALSADGSIVAAGGSGNDGNGSSSGHVRVFVSLE